jgi:hypothetical protein
MIQPKGFDILESEHQICRLKNALMDCDKHPWLDIITSTFFSIVMDCNKVMLIIICIAIYLVMNYT